MSAKGWRLLFLFKFLGFLRGRKSISGTRCFNACGRKFPKPILLAVPARWRLPPRDSNLNGDVRESFSNLQSNCVDLHLDASLAEHCPTCLRVKNSTLNLKFLAKTPNIQNTHSFAYLH